MLSKVRPCHSVNVLTFPGCDRSVGGGNGNGTDLRGCVCLCETERERVRNVCDLPTSPQSPVLDVCEDYFAGEPVCAQACAAEGLVMQEKSLRSGVLSYIMCLLLQVMMQVIIMRGMRHQHLELDPGELLA